MDKQTGGGDGDAERKDPTDDENEDALLTPVQNKVLKRKRAKKGQNEFSEAVLKAFQESKIFELIDAVFVLLCPK